MMCVLKFNMESGLIQDLTQKWERGERKQPCFIIGAASVRLGLRFERFYVKKLEQETKSLRNLWPGQ